VTDRTTKTVTIIGAGIGGLYLIAELGVAGFKLRLHDIDDSKLSEIRARGGVDVEGESDGFAAIERVTSDDVSRVMQRHLDPARLTTLVVGDFDVVREDLDRLGLGEPVVLSPDAF